MPVVSDEAEQGWLIFVVPNIDADKSNRISANIIEGAILPRPKRMMDILLMDFKQNQRVENGHSKVEGGIRGRSYSNEKMDTKAKGPLHPTRANLHSC